jgi:ABC-2 type transport system permease protein
MRYLRLYACFVRFAMSKTMEFRLDFYFRFIMDIAYYGVNLVFYETLFLHTTQLGGYSLGQARIFVGTFMVVDAITMTLFSNNIWWLPTYINRGDLDYYLVRPVSSLFFATLRDFSFSSFLNLLCAAGILIWALASYDQPLPLWRLPAFLVFIAMGALLHSMVYLLTVLPSFWLESGTGLHGMFYNFARLMERPDGIYTGWVRRVLLTVLPFAVMASFPARLLWEGMGWKLVGHFTLVVVGFFGLVLWVWHLGLKRYGSASS